MSRSAGRVMSGEAWRQRTARRHLADVLRRHAAHVLPRVAASAHLLLRQHLLRHLRIHHHLGHLKRGEVVAVSGRRRDVVEVVVVASEVMG